MILLKDKLGRTIGESVQFLIFDLELGKKVIRTALNVQKIKEVVDSVPLIEIPEPKNIYLGLLDLRDTTVPILNLNVALKLGTHDPTYQRIIVCDLQSVLLGLPVVRTRRIITCRTTDFLPLPPAIAQSAHVLFSGLITHNEYKIPLFDLDGIIHNNGLGPDLTLEADTAPSYEGKTILLVEDSRIVRLKIKKFFEDIGLRVIMAENGRDGLDRLRENLLDIDLIFTDIEMPYCDGIAMIRKFNSEFPAIKKPVIFNSALSNKRLIEDIQKEGLGDYIVKFNKEGLLEKLEAYLGAA